MENNNNERFTAEDLELNKLYEISQEDHEKHIEPILDGLIATMRTPEKKGVKVVTDILHPINSTDLSVNQKIRAAFAMGLFVKDMTGRGSKLMALMNALQGN